MKDGWRGAFLGYTVGMNNEIEQLKAEIIRLNDKIHVMRSLLWEWNVSSGPVWEYRRLKQIGEKPEDYSHWTEEEPDMPLFDDGDNIFNGEF